MHTMPYPDRTRIEVSQLQSGDIMMKGADDSKTSSLIKVGQKLTHPFRDATIVHAGLLTLDKDTQGFEEFYVVESQKDGLKRNKLLTDNASYGYIVFRPKNRQVQEGLANTAGFLITQQTTNRNIPYSYTDAISSLFKKHFGNVSLADKFLNSIIEGESIPLYCSKFVTFSLLAVHQQIQLTGTPSPLNNDFFKDINKSPSHLLEDLDRYIDDFRCVGYLPPTNPPTT